MHVTCMTQLTSWTRVTAKAEVIAAEAVRQEAIRFACTVSQF